MPGGNGLSGCLDSSVFSVKMKIVQYKNKLVSICRADGRGDCQYTASFGKTFSYDRPDLNGDGKSDYVIRDFSGSYGLDDVTHFMIFAQCKSGNFIKIGDNVFTTIKSEKSESSNHWIDLKVSRSCYEKQIDDTQERFFTIQFDLAKGMYGAPNGDSALISACTNKELSLP